MPKQKRHIETPKCKNIGIDHKLDDDQGTDLKKSFYENVESRFEYWTKVDDRIVNLRKKISEYELLITKTENVPANRPLLADWKSDIELCENKIRILKRNNDPVEYLYCVADVIREMEVSPVELNSEIASCKVNAAGPLRPRIKKKKLLSVASNENMFYAKPITSYFVGMSNVDKTKSAKKLAQHLHEVPLDTSDYEYCPKCIKEIMHFTEKPPSIMCGNCGLSIEVMDNTSASVHDKESTTHLPFTYRPKLHFISWSKRLQGKLRFSIPEDILDDIKFRLWKRKIKNVDFVTWEVVDGIVRGLASTDKRFADYYPHVYQITNIIRGTPLLTFTEEEEQEIYEYNALVLQMIFMILDYPPEIIRIFNTIKGDSNLRFYDNIIKMICKELGEKPFSTADIEVMKHGKGKDIVKALQSMYISYKKNETEIVPATVKIENSLDYCL